MIVGLAILARTGSATVNSVAGLANPLENAGGGARALAMGSAFVGVADDSSTMLWNPAGLSVLQNAEIALHHNSWLAGISQETVVLGVPVAGLGGFGLSVNYVNYGTFAGYDDTGARVGDYSASRFGVGLGWGKEVMKDLSAGISLKESMQTFASSNYSDVSADLGVLWSPAKNWRLGAAYSNLGTGVAGYSSASVLRAGGSYRVDFDKTNQMLFAASGALEPQGVNRLQVGVEETAFSALAFRLGYQANLADNQIQGMAGLTAGAGFSYKGLMLDYAYLPFGDLGAAQRISLTYQFGGGQ